MRIMYRRLVLVGMVVALAPISGLCGELPDFFQDEVDVDDSTVIVNMSSSEFLPDELGIDISNYWEIEGERGIGGFPATPNNRLESFYIVWDDKRLDIPDQYYLDVFDPNLQERSGWWDDEGGVLLTLSDDKDSILIEMESSQIACCGYVVTWIVGIDGNIVRFVDASTP